MRTLAMNREKGFLLIETMIALALLGLTAAAFLGGFSTAFRAITVSQERTIAESLAKSQIEYIKIQNYISTAEYDPANPGKSYQLVSVPGNWVEEGYDITINPPTSVISLDDKPFELQGIRVRVSRNSEEILTVFTYRTGK